MICEDRRKEAREQWLVVRIARGERRQRRRKNEPSWTVGDFDGEDCDETIDGVSTWWRNGELVIDSLYEQWKRWKKISEEFEGPKIGESRTNPNCSEEVPSRNERRSCRCS